MITIYKPGIFGGISKKEYEAEQKRKADIKKERKENKIRVFDGASDLERNSNRMSRLSQLSDLLMKPTEGQRPPSLTINQI